MKSPIGRPMRYKHLLKALEEDGLYCAAQIARFAEKQGLPRTRRADREARRKELLRIAMNRLATNHQFPFPGDGLVQVPGQAVIPGWHGWRWQSTMYQNHKRSVSYAKEPGR